MWGWLRTVPWWDPLDVQGLRDTEAGSRQEETCAETQPRGTEGFCEGEAAVAGHRGSGRRMVGLSGDREGLCMETWPLCWVLRRVLSAFPRYP